LKALVLPELIMLTQLVAAHRIEAELTEGNDPALVTWRK
jgi:hypothetical protein